MRLRIGLVEKFVSHVAATRVFLPTTNIGRGERG